MASYPENYSADIRSASKRMYRALVGLTRANYLTGHYDNKSFNMAKIPKEQFDKEMWHEFYTARKRARKYVELRAKYRGRIEKEFTFLVNFKNNI